MAGSVIDRFLGEDGKRLVRQQLLNNSAVMRDASIADEIAESACIQLYSAGEELIHQNGSDNRVAFILSGAVDILVNGKKVAERRSDSHVGEMAAIDPSAPRSATVVASCPSVVGWLSEAQVSNIARRHPDLWRNFAVTLAARLRERGVHIRQPNSAPVVFIGSATEGLTIARAIRARLERAELTLRVWDEGVFLPSGFACDDILRQVHECDFAILIVTGEDRVESRGVTMDAARDNVVFELGAFMSGIGRERTFVVAPRRSLVRIPSDLLGVNRIALDTDTEDSVTPVTLERAASEIMSAVGRLGTLKG